MIRSTLRSRTPAMTGDGASAAAVNSGKRKKSKRENAYLLFSKAVREDIHQKFGGVQAFNEHFMKNYYEEGNEHLNVAAVKMVVIGNMWSEAPPAVRSFFERAAERKNAWENAKELAGLDAMPEPKSIVTGGTAEAKTLSDEDEPIGRTRPAGGGKARRIETASSNSAGPIEHHAGNPAADSCTDFKAQEKASSKQQVRQTARKSAPVETGVDRLANTRRKSSNGKNEPKGDSQIPMAEATTFEKGRASVSKSIPRSSEAVVTSGANLRKPMGVEGGKHNESKDDTDTASKHKNSKGAKKIMLPEENAAKESKVQGKDKVTGEGEGVTKAKGTTRAQSTGVGIGAERGERKRKDGASDNSKDKRTSNGGNSNKATSSEKSNATGKSNGKGASREVDEARPTGERGSKTEKVAKDDRKANSTGQTIRSEKSDEKGGSRGGSKANIPTTNGAEDLNPRKESEGEPAKPKAKGTAEKREEMPSENEVSASKGKGRGKEKSNMAEKRKLKEDENLKGASSGTSSSKSQFEAREETKGAKDSRRASASKAYPNRSSNREKNATGPKKEASKRASLGSTVVARGRRGNKDVAKSPDDNPVASTSVFGLELGEKVPIEVEWPVEVQRSRKKTEERLEWFAATVDLLKQVRTDEEGRPKWVIFYARHGSLPASKSKVTFLTEDKLMDDFEDEPLRWRKKGSNLKTSAEVDSSPRRPGSASGSVASSCDQEAEWDDVFGSKSRRLS